jgi:hypothetical protein
MGNGRAGISEQWRASPWTIKAFAALTMLAIVGNWFVTDFDAWRVVGSILFSALFLYGLLQGSRTAWVLLLILESLSVLSLVGIAVGRMSLENQAMSFAINAPIRALDLFVLLHPLTRAWLRPQGQASSERLRELAYPEKE